MHFNSKLSSLSIHSVARHKPQGQSVECQASELTSSVAVLAATAVQMQGWPLLLCNDCHEFWGGDDHSSVLRTSSPEIYLNKNSYMRDILNYVGL